MPKRGTDHTWEYVKFKGDAGIYVRCKCGFFVSAYHHENPHDGTWDIAPNKYLYAYCPNCGARKKRHTDSINKLDKKWEDEVLWYAR